MKRHILLTGEMGSGKTTLIRRALGGALRYAGGFATVRVMSGGVLAGFELTGAAALAAPEPRGARFLDFTAAPRFDMDVFRTHGAHFLRAAALSPFAVIDETGGMELADEGFYSELRAFLRSDTPWLCVIKTPGAAGELRARTGGGALFAGRAEALRAELAAREDTLEVTVRRRGDAGALAALESWAEEYAIQCR